MGAKKRKIVLLIGLAFCLVSAETGYTAQEVFCGDKLLSKCISHYQKQCDDKNYATCGIVGDLWNEGEEYRNATKYLEMACENANIKATYQINQIDGSIEKMSGIFTAQISCKLLGHLYYRGKGMRQDIDKAIKCYKKSCDLGDSDSCGHTGLMYYTKQDFKNAKEILAKSCEKLENAKSCGLLGAMYADGKGVKTNLSKAKELFGKACDFGEQLGCDGYKKLNEMNIK